MTACLRGPGPQPRCRRPGQGHGRAATLEPLPPDERARRYAAAFTAGLSLEDQARAALDRGEAAWAAELAQLQVDAAPDDPGARELLARSLEALGRGHINANARNWYLTEALERRGELELRPSPPGAAPAELIDGLPVATFMRAMPPRLRAEDVLEVDWTAVFHFTDTGSSWVMHVRRGVAEMRERPEAVAREAEADLRVTTTARTWKRVVTGHESAMAAIVTGALELEGGPVELARLQGWFER